MLDILAMTISSLHNVQSERDAPRRAALRELRAPLVALAVLALVVQLLLPVVAARAGTLAFGGFSICLGADGEQQDGQGGAGHAGGCVCGPACAHGACGGCKGANAAITFDFPVFAGIIVPMHGPPAFSERPGDRLAQSRAPPVFS
jgi:hypothetical protein